MPSFKAITCWQHYVHYFSDSSASKFYGTPMAKYCCFGAPQLHFSLPQPSSESRHASTHTRARSQRRAPQ